MKRSYFLSVILVFSSMAYCLHAEPREQTHFIFITGGSSSGKTTFARYCAERFGESKTLVIHLDEYLDKRVQSPDEYIDGIPNFDNPSMVNWDLLLLHLKQLNDKESIEKPRYSFSEWMPVGQETLSWKPIVIVEGIHALQAPLDSIKGLRIYLHCDEKIRYDRRLVRDQLERGYSIDLIHKTFFEMALPYEKIFLIPTKAKADIYIENLKCNLDLKKAAEYVWKAFETNQIPIRIVDNDLITESTCP